MVSRPVRVIIVAAGSGTRFGGDVAKQFCLLAGRPVLMYAVDAFRMALGGKEQIILVLSDSAREYWTTLCNKYGFESPEVVTGGATRVDSVRNGLAALPVDDDAVVLVHDGARPLVTAEIIDGVIAAASRYGAVIPVVPVVDSLREISHDSVSHAVDRSGYRAVQTPQGFSEPVLRHAYESALQTDVSFTDDASVVEASGHAVAMCEGDSVNIKITNPQDLAVAEVLLARR